MQKRRQALSLVCAFLCSAFQHGFRFQDRCAECFLHFAFGGKNREQKVQRCLNPFQIVLRQITIQQMLVNPSVCHAQRL